MDSLLNVKDLQVSFTNRDKEVRVVHSLNFQVFKNEILGIVGESGSGKSVSSMALMGLLPNNAEVKGVLEFDAKDLNNLSSLELRKIIGKEIAMVFQEPMTSLNPSLTCGTQVAEVLALHTSLTKTEIKKEVIVLFKKVKLPRAEDMYHQYPHQLSGGQKQRVMIAMAIACKPKLLIADEPTTALDVTVQKEIVLLLKELQEENEMGIVFITHDLALIAEIAQRVVVMQKGRVVEQGSVEEIFKNPKEVYTKALINAKPKLDKRLKRLPTVANFIDNSYQELEYTRVERDQFHQKIYSQEPLLEVRNLKTYYSSKKGWFQKSVVKGVDDVSFKVYKGETLGLVGESGSGKSTIGRSILGLEKATGGSVFYKGIDILKLSAKERKKLNKEIQLIFQDPYSSLNPKIKVGEAILEPMKVHGVLDSNKARKEYIEEILETVGLQKEHYNRYPHEFSGGQRQRIGIARALALQPQLIVCDESVSALDVSVQAQVLNLLNELKEKFQFTYIFISHDLSVVKFMSDQLLVLNKGKIEELGDADSVYLKPKKEYTQALINAIPKGV